MIKYRNLVDALKASTEEDEGNYVHYESSMYQWEKPNDVKYKLKYWMGNISENTKIKQYFNLHKDLGHNILRTHLVYNIKKTETMVIFSCNYENLEKLNLKNLEIVPSESGLAKLVYLKSKSEVEKINK